VRYIGITTSEGAKHAEMERALKRERFDFVQFTYNLADRRVEERLLPLAAEQKIAVVINRPFDGAGSSRRCAASRCRRGRARSIARTGPSSSSNSSCHTLP
jgi:aryl-alcohol dehydrogenase-like predicted oxidoreductase